MHSGNTAADALALLHCRFWAMLRQDSWCYCSREGGKPTLLYPTWQQVSHNAAADVEPEPPHCSCTCLVCLQVLGDYKATLAALVQQGKLLRKEAADRRAQLASFDSDHDKATAEKTHAERALRRLKDDQQDT